LPGIWQFWLDRGGTFTDCIGVSPEGRVYTSKRLSTDDAGIVAIGGLLEAAGALEPGHRLPPCSVKIGTTLATNALLTRQGARTLLVANTGLGDAFEIGTQARPDLFALHIELPPPLHESTLEVEGRCGANGALVAPLDEAALRAGLRSARAKGIDSVAIAMIHAHAYPALELRIGGIAREVGFSYIVTSHEIARELGLLSRGQTAVADAYLTPILRHYTALQAAALPQSSLRFMQSSGGLTDAARFRGPGALLSGPAGGAVGAARVASAGGFREALAFDMGGTSTDVSLIVDGEVERVFETSIAGIHVRQPTLRVHSIAAGGGSLCRFDGFRLTVGPESAGADPGPLCYGLRRESPKSAGEGLTLTDVNVLLGRLPEDRFPLALHLEPARRALEGVVATVRAAGHALSFDQVGQGFLEIANASMAEAIRQVSVARGVDPRDCALVGFGGAAGQHVCAVARLLGIRTILLHPLASLLSAYGIGMAPQSWDRQRDAGRLALEAAPLPLPEPVRRAFSELEAEGRSALHSEGVAPQEVRIVRRLDLRYAGAESALTIAEPENQDWIAAFEQMHKVRFGYIRKGRAIEIVVARVQALQSGPASSIELRSRTSKDAPGPARPIRSGETLFCGLGRCETPLFAREDLGRGTRLVGPALVVDDTSTVVIDPGFQAEVDPLGVLVLQDREGLTRPHSDDDLSYADPVRLEVLGNAFMSIAEQMGAVLRNTAVSTNIKERLDYSCAVFDQNGGLVANAPHIPVHLGAMGETVRAIKRAFPVLSPGDVAMTNDPHAGGSHLPDVTVVTPVFVESVAPRFFVASRGHHADLGGKTPGSMPSDSRSLEEEGVVLSPILVVRGGRFAEEQVRAALVGARYPARNPDDNVADLEAMVAANRAGESLLHALVARRGLASVEATMAQLQLAAGQKVARAIASLPAGDHVFEDRLDDGTRIRVSIQVAGPRMRIDFTGTDPATSGNLNAPRAVVQAALLYVLRCLVAERIPLNGGCLAPVEVVVPEGSLLDPPPGAAVVGGNVETSQRIVDVLLGALGLAAASQGTMNNVTFGNARFGYYETIGGGAGAGPTFSGASGVHVHMTNTRITDAEVLETRYPVRLLAFRVRRNSGGAGRHLGGDGLVRVYKFLAPVTLSLLTERRVVAPFGLDGGEPAARGENRIRRRGGAYEEIPGRATLELAAEDELWIATPGGGGFGRVPEPDQRSGRR
jgi:5-oxoprolinase (ATP-hydrolysing)